MRIMGSYMTIHVKGKKRKIRKLVKYNFAIKLPKSVTIRLFISTFGKFNVSNLKFLYARE